MALDDEQKKKMIMGVVAGGAIVLAVGIYGYNSEWFKSTPPPPKPVEQSDLAQTDAGKKELEEVKKKTAEIELRSVKGGA